MGDGQSRGNGTRFEYLRDYPVLYVDDEAPNLFVFQSTFSDEFEVLTASSAEEALKLMAGRRIAVLLADHRMKDMTGVELCEAVREKHPHVGRILVTAYSDQKTAIDAINRAGVARYLAKPWRLDDVRQVLREAIARAHLENTVRSLNAEIIDRERLATLAAMRARLLHDLANLNLSVQGSCMSLEALLPRAREGLGEHDWVQMREAVSNLRMAVDHMTSLHQKREQAARLAPASKAYWPVHEILDTVRELTRGEILCAGARLEMDCAHDLRVFADRTDVARILINLLSNALHAIEAAGVHPGEVRIRAYRNDETTALEVSDNGAGVPRRLARRIFEPAFTTRADHGGSGLGLAICRELAMANDGTVDLVEPRRDRKAASGGAQFVVRLPEKPLRG
jgi:signal transduction histidine kinase